MKTITITKTYELYRLDELGPAAWETACNEVVRKYGTICFDFNYQDICDALDLVAWYIPNVKISQYPGWRQCCHLSISDYYGIDERPAYILGTDKGKPRENGTYRGWGTWASEELRDIWNKYIPELHRLYDAMDALPDSRARDDLSDAILDRIADACNEIERTAEKMCHDTDNYIYSEDFVKDQDADRGFLFYADGTFWGTEDNIPAAC